METDARTTEITVLGVGFSFLIKLIMVEKHITPPVIMGNCTDAGSFARARRENRLPIPEQTAYPLTLPSSLNETIVIFLFFISWKARIWCVGQLPG